ncbi:spore coat protein CotJB [Ferdinandcohnia quinoae]|uniref:Spore coat protein CotJB n=1 Tax=Fredinandcohnia quinoae TaxID=2918902 RepID=A0AAW5DZN0_9BACI|nr:spore coat protein CotJB [Fredinandcohnia sp. SECRCQ15]MCH1624779.1 spore coat protein CotJB [Fredinandcohnia sp. SECRCQ15]
MKQLPPEYYTLLEELQAVDFVLVELTLYLDTHPNDYEAIQQFNHCSQQRRKLAKVFESKFGPLLQFGHSYSNYPWDWKDVPWPWQV